MLANRTSRWSLAAAALCIVLLAASWFLLISPRRADAFAVRAQAAQSDAQAVQLQVDIADLKAQFADLPKQRAELKAIKRQLPPQAGIPELLRDLRQIAARSGTTLDSLIPGTPSVLGATSGSGPVTAGTGSVITIPLQLSVTGGYFEASLYVKHLQTKLQRSMLITAINSAPATATEGESTETATATSSPAATATATATATAAAAVTSTQINLERVTLTITTSLFVLMDGTTTLEDMIRQVRAAGGLATATPVPIATPVPTGTVVPTAAN